MFVEVADVVKSYKNGESDIDVLNDLSMSVKKGDICVIIGSSGSGKSTLLNIIGGLDSINSGKIVVDGIDISNLSAKELTKYRKNYIGFVFQFYNLISNLNLKENICVGEYLTDTPIDIDELITLLGLEKHKDKFPSQLSGGQQQRCAIGRALVKNPKLLLCDEPTGALDSKSSKEVMQILEDINKKYGTTILIVTHNEVIKEASDSVICIKDGRVIDSYKNENKKFVSQLEF